MCEHNHQVYNCVDCQEKKEQRDREEAIANGARYESSFRDVPGYVPGWSSTGGLFGLLLLVLAELWDAIKRDGKSK